VRMNCLMIAQLQSADHSARKGRTRQVKFWVRETPHKGCGAQGRKSMCKSIAAIASLAAILSLGSLVAAHAGGAATSAPSKYDNASQSQWHSQNTRYTITEFSSSSARATKPKR
jgi:hypothetical protein